MSSRTAALWIVLFCVLAIVGGGKLLDGGNGGGGIEGKSPKSGVTRSSTGVVVRVVDGDTVRVRLDGSTTTVRYIGVDTPETVKPHEPVQCFGKQASAFNRKLVAGRRVRLQLGPERYDR